MDKFEKRRQALRALVDSMGRGAIASVAKQIGIEPSYVSRLLYSEDKKGGKRMGEDTATALSKAFPSFFIGENALFDDAVLPATPAYAPPVAPPLSSDIDPAEGYARLPVLAEAAAGHGKYPAQEVVQHIDVLESYVRQRLHANPRTLKVLTARGSSMTGVIEDGDIMFVQPTNEFTDDGIYILTLDDLIRVKRLSVSMTTGNVLIESNDGRKAEELPLKEVPHRLHIQGRVLGSWSLRSFA
ncbi:S24 family peptidase [Comamonas jiangduensis]|uniref:S24 family peptidase n=1 Tax=Comamonas jiangduensis TaxID=1194168 RepID=UPI0024E098B3|nr:S24 family peptidase [Comamonas jiangduensis]